MKTKAELRGRRAVVDSGHKGHKGPPSSFWLLASHYPLLSNTSHPKELLSIKHLFFTFA